MPAPDWQHWDVVVQFPPGPEHWPPLLLPLVPLLEAPLVPLLELELPGHAELRLVHDDVSLWLKHLSSAPWFGQSK